jgi:uncharacterized membrane protein
MKTLRSYIVFIGGLTIAAHTILSVTYALYVNGYTLFSIVDLPSYLKNGLSLVLTLGFLSVLLASSSLFTHGLWLTILPLSSLCLGVSSIIYAKAIGVDALPLDLLGFIAIAILGFGLGYLFKEKPTYKLTVRLSSFEVACTAIFSALTAVATAFTGQFFPSPTGGYTHIGDTVIFISALILGPKLGALIGALGAVAADIYVGYPRWFVSIPAHGLEGFIAGLGRGRKFYVQIILCGLGGVVMATIYFYVNIFIKGLAPALISLYRDVFGQVVVSIILTALLKPALSKILPKKI